MHYPSNIPIKLAEAGVVSCVYSFEGYSRKYWSTENHALWGRYCRYQHYAPELFYNIIGFKVLPWLKILIWENASSQNVSSVCFLFSHAVVLNDFAVIKEALVKKSMAFGGRAYGEAFYETRLKAFNPYSLPEGWWCLSHYLPVKWIYQSVLGCSPEVSDICFICSWSLSHRR